MSLKLPGPMLKRFVGMEPEEQAERIASMSYDDLLSFDAEFEVWAHKGQLPPSGEGWRVWLMMAGRGFGKTRAGAEWIHRLASINERRIALVGASMDEARKIMVEGVSGLLTVAHNHRVRLKWEPSLNQLTWPNGSIATLFSGDSPDSLRGPEHHFAWFLTFEIEADEAPISIAHLLADASGGLVDVSDGRTVAGFAAHGSSIGDSVRPLVELRGLALAERDGKLRGPSTSSPDQLLQDELGCDTDGEVRPSVEHLRAPDSSLPSRQTLAYYDRERDYQAGQMGASSGGGGAVEIRTELPAVLAADEAKQWVEEGLARRWQAASSLRLRLPPSRFGIGIGDHVQLPGSNRPMTVRSTEIDGMAVVIEAQAADADVAPLPADPGRAVPDPDIPVSRSDLALFELPALGEAPEASARLFVAASNQGKWKPIPIELRLGPDPLVGQAITRRSTLGTAETILDPRAPMTLDELSSVTVRLTNDEQYLTNADADALMAGANLAAIGDELIQFGRAEQLGPGLFRLSRLLRGRRATEWAAFTHSVGDRFCLFDAVALGPIDLPAGAAGAVLTAVAHGIGDAEPLPEAERQVSGEAMRPPSVCHLRTWRDAGQLHFNWVRRSHRGWAWNDGVGVPPDLFPERYRLTVIAAAGRLMTETETPSATFDVASLPAQPGQTVEIQVHLVGPMAVSRPTSVSLTI